MARPKATPPAPAADVDTAGISQDLSALDALTEAKDERATAIATLGEQFGVMLPRYQRDVYIDQARFYMAQSAEAAVRLGITLTAIKEAEPHGEFLKIVEGELGIAVRAAQRMMQAAVRFSSGAGQKLLANASLATHLSKAKMFELMTLDDDSLEELADGKSVLGIDLDEIACMSSNELRAALRNASLDLAAKDSVLSDKDKKINSLTVAKKRAKSEDPDGARLALLERDLVDASSESAKLIRVDHKDVLAQLELQEWSTGQTVPTPEVQERIDLIARQALERVVTALRERAVELGIAPADIGLADEAQMPEDFQ